MSGMAVWHAYLRDPKKQRHPVATRRELTTPHAIVAAESATEAAAIFERVYRPRRLEAYDISLWMGGADFVYFDDKTGEYDIC